MCYLHFNSGKGPILENSDPMPQLQNSQQTVDESRNENLFFFQITDLFKDGILVILPIKCWLKQAYLSTKTSLFPLTLLPLHVNQGLSCSTMFLDQNEASGASFFLKL